MLDVTSIFNRPTNTVIFADSTLPDLATLQAGFPANAEVYLLPAGCDGLLFIADTLAGRSSIEAIHLLTHGTPGALQMGAVSLNYLNLTRYTCALNIISNAMVEDGQWLIYGCDVAQGAEGQRFVQALRLMTGLQVAAASHKVGAEELEGSWELDYGMVEQQKILTIPQWQGVLALPGAHSATAAGEVFLGGNFIELGISAVGSFGTVGSKPAGFYGTTGSTKIGMGNDADGFGVGTDLRIDYFIPGTAEERWGVGYNGSTYGSYSKLVSNAGEALTATSLTNTSIASNLGATFTGTVGAALIVSQAISFGVDDKIFKNTVTLTNTTGATLTGVTYMRSFDPDNTQFYNSGDFITINTIENTFAVDGKSVISAKSPIGEPYYVDAGNKQATILFYTTEAGASTYLGGGTNPFSLTSPGAKGDTVTGDKNISMKINAGDLAAGASTTIVYYTSLDTSDISTTIATIAAAKSLTYSNTTFTEALANDGSISTVSTITLTNETFASTNGSVLPGAVVTNVPAGLTAVVTQVSATTATVAFTGKATTHVNANDIANLTVTLGDAAFTGGSAATVTGATTSNLVVDFADPPKSLAYSNTTFTEALANNGAISTVSTITLTNETFAGTNGSVLPGAVVTNVPAGLTAVVTQVNATTATVAFTGKATTHANANDIANLTVTLGNAAFTGGSSATVTGATTSNLVVDFADPPKWLTYSNTTFTEAAANNGSISTVSTITLSNETFAGANGSVLPGAVVTNVPAGLTAVITKTSATTASIGFTGTATAHANVNDISDLTVTLGNTTFTGGSAAAVKGSITSNLVVDFVDPVITTTATGTHTPTPTPTPTSTSTTPTPDTDGVPDMVEDTIPGLVSTAGMVAVVGDGNGDGIADRQQSNVTSLVSFINSASVYTTLVADSKEGKIDTTDSNSATLSNVQQLSAPTNLSPVMKMPLGLTSFSSTVSSGANIEVVTETFSLYVDSNLGINGYWTLNTAGTWVNLASSIYGGKIATEGGKTRLDFHLTDGGQFDTNGQIDGVIASLGAAGSMPLSLVGYAPDLAAGTHLWF